MATSIIDLLMFSFTLRAAGAFFPMYLVIIGKGLFRWGYCPLIIGGIVSVIFERKWIPGLTFFGWEGQPVIPGLACAFIIFIIFSIIMPNKNEIGELTSS